MVNEQLVMIDLEAEETPQVSSPNVKMDEVAQCGLPIRSDHCAASLSLADAFLFEDGSNDSTVVVSNHVDKLGSASTIRLSQRSYFCWGMCLVLTTIAVLLGVIGAFTRGNSMLLHPRPRISDVIEYLQFHNISSHDELATFDSPQNLAAQWLAESDLAQLPIPVTYDYLYVTRYVMALNYFALNGEAWTSKLNFMKDMHVCDWNDAKNAVGSQGVGLLCDENYMPEVLDLEYNGLAGSIPTENGLLTTFAVFDLDMNAYIEGEFPSELCSLTNLKSLTLGGNDLGGYLPSCLGKLHKLTSLNVESNNFSGPLPSDVCAMTHVQYFVAQRNLLSGSLPSCMGKWSDLKVLAISDNAFHGTLPTELVNLKHLQELTINDNRFRGDPLPIIDTLTDLKMLYASNNYFTGILHPTTCKDLQNLEIFDISRNNFTASELPSHILQMPKLEVLDMSMNSLETQLPKDIQENNVLWFFSANKNFLYGDIPRTLKNLSSLRHLDLSNNGFQGPLRSELFQMTSLENLFLSENPFLHQGKIPETISGMTQLKEISLKNTNRNGTLPQLLDFVNLMLLDLDNNGFTGTIPKNYANLRNLVYLMLNRNPIGGLVPDFGNVELLHTILLDGTAVWGNLSSICGLPAFIGDPDSLSRAIAVAECGGESGRVLCTCCHCCDASAARLGSCSDPYVASLDWTWEYGFHEEARDFGINRSSLEGPIF